MSTGWVAAGVAAVGVVAGASASNKAAKNQAAATQAAKDSADGATQLGYEELAFSKEQYADAKPIRDKTAATAQEVAEAQLVAQRQNTALAGEYDAYNKGTYRPLEQGIVADATGYDTPEKRQAAADAAQADVNKAFAGSNEASARRLAANGIDPGSTRAMSVMDGQAVSQATANAGAAFNARKGIETTGFARKMDAASLGRNLPSSQATSAGLGITAGNSAVTSANASLAATNAGVAGVQAGYSGAIGANTAAGGLYNSASNIAANAGASSNALWGGVGNVAGRLITAYQQPSVVPTAGVLANSSPYAGIGTDYNALAGDAWTSDENMKTDIKPVGDDEALREIAATPVKKWRYSAAKMAAAGLPMDDGAEHVGPMAQRVNATMGEAAAPGGKKIDPITMNGKAMLGIQALDKKTTMLAKKVDSLASRIASGEVAAGESRPAR